MKNYFILFCLAFFAPKQSFAIVNTNTSISISAVTIKKTDSPKKIKKSTFWLAIATGFLIGGLISTSTPVLAIVCYILCLVCCIVGVVYAVEGL